MLERELSGQRLCKKIFYGQKELEVNINTERFTASVRFGTRDEWWCKKLAGETTIVFILADDFIQEAANKYGKPILLTFDSASTNLILWARSRKDFLGFDSVEPEKEASYRITVSKTYIPCD